MRRQTIRPVRTARRIGQPENNHEPRLYYVAVVSQHNDTGERFPVRAEDLVVARSATRAAELCVKKLRNTMPGLANRKGVTTLYEVDVIHMADSGECKEAWHMEVASKNEPGRTEQQAGERAVH